nr:hypothetical protein [Angustibacter aerolatus]
MTGVHRLSQRDARRLAVRARLLALPRPADVLEVARGLTVLQARPDGGGRTERRPGALEPAGLGVLPARACAPCSTAARSSSTWGTCDRPRTWRCSARRWPPGPAPASLREWQVHLREWVEANDACRRDLLDRLRAGGPLSTREPARHLRAALAVDGLDERQERGEACSTSWSRAARSPSSAAAAATGCGTSPNACTPTGRTCRTTRPPVFVATCGCGRSASPAPAPRRCPASRGTSASWVSRRSSTACAASGGCTPSLLDGAPFRGRTALISPLDRLVHDRTRMADLFGFDYQPGDVQAGRPAALGLLRAAGARRRPARRQGSTRRPTARRVLRVHALHEDAPFTAAVRASVHDEIADLARWLGLEPAAARRVTPRRQVRGGSSASSASWSAGSCSASSGAGRATSSGSASPHSTVQTTVLVTARRRACTSPSSRYST